MTQQTPWCRYTPCMKNRFSTARFCFQHEAWWLLYRRVARRMNKPVLTYREWVRAATSPVEGSSTGV